MISFCRWLCIRLLIKCCGTKAPDFSDARKSYIVLDRLGYHIRLIGQQPGAAYASPGRRVMVLLGECVHYVPNRTVLRTAGAIFKSHGILQTKPGPGQSWCWYLQLGK